MLVNISLLLITTVAVAISVFAILKLRNSRFSRATAEFELKKITELFSELFNANQSAVAIVRLHDWTLLDVNDQYLRFFDFLEKTSILGKPADDLKMFINVDRRIDTGKNEFRNEHIHKKTEINFFDKAGRVKWATFLVKTIYLEGVECLMVVLTETTALQIARDEIRKLKEDRTEILSRLEEATQENKETDLFIHTVFHNLRDSLLVIDGYADGLLSHYEEMENDQDLTALEVITYNARRMSLIIDNLLNLSRLTRKELVVKPVNMNDMLKHVAQEQLAIYNNHRCEIKASYLPMVNCDMILMRHVWANIISNALKFSSTKERTFIEVGCSRQKDNHFVFSVKDNGVGFDMDYVGKLFKTFARLHKFREFDGTGVGLVIVDKAIKRLGGRAWAESVLNEGSTFYFSLPAGHEVLDLEEIPTF